MLNARLVEAQAGIKISRRNINNLRCTDDTSLMAKSKEQLKSLLMKVKEESEKSGLKLSIQKDKIMASSPITSWQIDGETVETVSDYFSGLQNHHRGWLQPWNSKTLASWKKNEEQPRQHIKKQKHHFDYKSPSNQSTGFSSSLVWMWEFDHKESWVPKNWCFSTVLLEKTLESPLDCKEIKSVNFTGNLSWIFTGCTVAEAEVPILWSPDTKNWLIGKDPDAGKIEGRRKRGWQKMRWLDGITNSMDMRLNSSGSLCWTAKPGVLQSMGSQSVRHNWVTELN